MNTTMPTGEDAIGRPAVEGAIDLDCPEALDVVSEPIAQRDALRIQDALPVIVAPAGCASMNGQ
jgi:hypothetical protein